MSVKFRWWYILWLILSLASFNNALAEEITVAVASNFSGPAKVLACGFEDQTGHHVKLVFGSSGRIYAQIRHGAPFDVFLSADRLKPAALETHGMTLTGSRFTYAIGALALWSSRPDFITTGADILKQGQFHRIALANAKLAPYGIAARQVLQSLALYDVLSAKFVQGENIAQTYQFVATGNADLGFVARSQLPGDNRGSVWLIPEELHQPIRQDAVILKSAEDNPAALAFVKFLRSDFAERIIRRHGYKIPTEDQ